MKKVAVVEDSPTNRLLARVLLEDHYEVVEYKTGHEALDGFRRDKPDLVLLDLTLPDIDGSEVLRQIRADEGLRGLRVMAFTAGAKEEDRASFVAAGFDDYVAKPITDKDAMLKVIRRGLAGGATA